MEGRDGKAGCDTRCVDEALLGRRQRGAACHPELSSLQQAPASARADVWSMWVRGQLGMEGAQWARQDLQLRGGVRLPGQATAGGSTVQRRGDHVGRGPGYPDVLPPPRNSGRRGPRGSQCRGRVRGDRQRPKGPRVASSKLKPYLSRYVKGPEKGVNNDHPASSSFYV